MAKKLNMKVKTDKDILAEFILKYQPKDADLMDAFGVSRQQVWKYQTGNATPSTERLVRMAGSAEWTGDMAREMLTNRGIHVAVNAIYTAKSYNELVKMSFLPEKAV